MRRAARGADRRRTSPGALRSSQATSSTPKPSPSHDHPRTAGTSAISRRSAWRTLRPRAIRPSTGTPTLAARCSIASKTVNASSHGAADRRVERQRQRHGGEVGGDDDRLLGPREPQRRLERALGQLGADEREEDLRARGRRLGRAAAPAHDDARSRRSPTSSASERDEDVAAAHGAPSRLDRSATIRRSTPGQPPQQPLGERRGEARRAGRAPRACPSGRTSSRARARRARPPRRRRRPPRRARSRRAATRAGAARRAARPLGRRARGPGARTVRMSSSAPSRCAERHARRTTRCDDACGVTSASSRSPTACGTAWPARGARRAPAAARARAAWPRRPRRPGAARPRAAPRGSRPGRSR